MATDGTRSLVDRFDEEGDWIVQQMFSAEDLARSPEEYAAHHAQDWGCFSFHRYRYLDPDLGVWVRRLGEILFDQAEVERCRKRFLSMAKYAEMKQRETEEF